MTAARVADGVAVVPVVAAPSPRVLWAALGNEVGLALWLRTPTAALSRQIDGLMRQAEFEVIASGTADDVSEEVHAQFLAAPYDTRHVAVARSVAASLEQAAMIAPAKARG